MQRTGGDGALKRRARRQALAHFLHLGAPLLHGRRGLFTVAWITQASFSISLRRAAREKRLHPSSLLASFPTVVRLTPQGRWSRFFFPRLPPRPFEKQRGSNRAHLSASGESAATVNSGFERRLCLTLRYGRSWPRAVMRSIDPKHST